MKTNHCYIGDCLDTMREWPDECVQMCVTSPPYWGLRDYGVDGQYGLEATYPEYIANMAAVFDEVRRVLRPDGTLWLNLGDCFATGGGAVDRRPGGDQRPRRISSRLPCASGERVETFSIVWALAVLHRFRSGAG